MSLTRTLAFASALALAAPTAALAAPNAPVATQTVASDAVRAPAPASGQENRYAEREQQDPKVGEYEGGNTVVIGISGGALVVLLLILLLI